MAFGVEGSNASDDVVGALPTADKDIAIHHVPSVEYSVGVDMLLLVCFLVTVLLVGFVLRLFLQMWRARIECQWSEDEAAVRQLV
uniref:Uncharacterized protein n=1 Tax=Anopheles stephensi TaxID=30069 RepID=A0A182YD37_ANOST